MIDIGANLSHESFQHDLDEVLNAAKDAGIENIILTGTCLESSQKALNLAEESSGYLYSTAGIHPHDAKLFDSQSISELKQLAQHSLVKAIGEAGLDFNRDFSPRPQQELAYCEQLALAVELQMPVFLHQRDAHERFLPILKEYREYLPKGVVHCFTGNKKELFDYLDLDMHIGITGWICDERRGHDLHPLIKEIPENRLMIETDSPYLMPRTISPKPKTRRNEPANLSYVLETIAHCLGKRSEDIKNQISFNSGLFFGL